MAHHLATGLDVLIVDERLLEVVGGHESRLHRPRDARGVPCYPGQHAGGRHRLRQREVLKELAPTAYRTAPIQISYAAKQIYRYPGTFKQRPTTIAEDQCRFLERQRAPRRWVSLLVARVRHTGKSGRGVEVMRAVKLSVICAALLISGCRSEPGEQASASGAGWTENYDLQRITAQVQHLKQLGGQVLEHDWLTDMVELRFTGKNAVSNYVARHAMFFGTVRWSSFLMDKEEKLLLACAKSEVLLAFFRHMSRRLEEGKEDSQWTHIEKEMQLLDTGYIVHVVTHLCCAMPGADIGFAGARRDARVGHLTELSELH
eukprot:2926583-Rhodomonas_salina.3